MASQKWWCRDTTLWLSFYQTGTGACPYKCILIWKGKTYKWFCLHTDLIIVGGRCPHLPLNKKTSRQGRLPVTIRKKAVRSSGLLYTDIVCLFILKNQIPSFFKISGMSLKVLQAWAPWSANISSFSLAVPIFPSTIAPACPIRFREGRKFRRSLPKQEFSLF